MHRSDTSRCLSLLTNLPLLATAAVLSLAVVPASAQTPAGPHPITVVLKDGDTLNGMLAPSDGSGLTIDSGKFGPISLPWAAIADLRLTDPVRVRIEDGSVIEGTATWVAGALSIQAQGATLSVLPATMLGLEWVGQPPPTWRDHWNIVGSTSSDLKRGNTNTLNVNLTSNVTYRSASYGVGVYGGRGLARTGTGDEAMTTADSSKAGGRLDKYLGDNLFLFGSGDFSYDRFQQVRRAWLTVGLGDDLISTKRAVFTLMAGFVRARDEARLQTKTARMPSLQVDGSRQYNEMELGIGLRRRVGKKNANLSADWTLDRQLGEADVNVTVSGVAATSFAVPLTGLLRSDLRAQLDVPVSKRVAWQVQFEHSYVNHPYPNSKPSDVSVTFGLNLNVGNSKLAGYSGSSSNVGVLAGSGAVKSAVKTSK